MYSKKANFKRYQIIKNKDMEIYQKVKKVTHECNFLDHLEIWCVWGGGEGVSLKTSFLPEHSSLPSTSPVIHRQPRGGQPLTCLLLSPHSTVSP